jgi:hypothetical protein
MFFHTAENIDERTNALNRWKHSSSVFLASDEIKFLFGSRVTVLSTLLFILCISAQH